MISDEIRQKLQNIIRGIILEKQKDPCATIRNLLCRSFETGPTVKSKFESRAIIKEKQAQFLKEYAIAQDIWMEAIPEGCVYLAKGGEATVFLAADNRNVIKVNDAIYYATWLEYLNSILIHTLLFPETAYLLLGFTQTDRGLSIVLVQPFVKGEQAALDGMKIYCFITGSKTLNDRITVIRNSICC